MKKKFRGFWGFATHFTISTKRSRNSLHNRILANGTIRQHCWRGQTCVPWWLLPRTPICWGYKNCPKMVHQTLAKEECRPEEELWSLPLLIFLSLSRSNSNCEVAIARLHTIDALVISMYRPSGKNFAICKFQEALSWISQNLTEHADDLQTVHISLMGIFTSRRT